MIFLSSFNRRSTFFEMGLKQMNGQEASSFTIDLRLSVWARGLLFMLVSIMTTGLVLLG